MTSTGLSALFHVRNIGVGKEAVVSCAVLGQTQAEYLKIDLFFLPSLFCLSLVLHRWDSILHESDVWK